MLPGFSSQDTTVSANPASFTFHNISLENSPLIVECVNSNEDVSRAMIVVEGKRTIMNNVMQNKWGIEGVPICMTHHAHLSAIHLHIIIHLQVDLLTASIR